MSTEPVSERRFERLSDKVSRLAGELSVVRRTLLLLVNGEDHSAPKAHPTREAGEGNTEISSYTIK